MLKTYSTFHLNYVVMVFSAGIYEFNSAISYYTYVSFWESIIELQNYTASIYAVYVHFAILLWLYMLEYQ